MLKRYQIMEKVAIALFLPLLFILFIPKSYAIPQGPIISYNLTQTPAPRPAASITTPGGSFTVLVLNVSQQSYKWKAYVGNVTGKLSLDDASGNTIYDWTLATISGEVYASRSSSINWSSIQCASQTIIDNEETALNIPSTAPDSINATFKYNSHKSFYVGTILINQNTCRSTATYINDAPQTVDPNAKFQEILLSDGTNLVYVTLLEDNQAGYNNQLYDFQMIVADDESASTPSTYYFWVELG